MSIIVLSIGRSCLRVPFLYGALFGQWLTFLHSHIWYISTKIDCKKIVMLGERNEISTKFIQK